MVNNVEEYLPYIEGELPANTVVGVCGVQIGQAILSSETEWHSEEDLPYYSLMEPETAFDADLYPLLALVYPSLTTPAKAAPLGSPWGYKFVAEYVEAEVITTAGMHPNF